MRDLVKEFRDKCQTKIASKRFSPADFEESMTIKTILEELTLNYVHHNTFIGIHNFLDESGPELQRVFDSSCGFRNVQSVLMQHIEYMVEDIMKLRSNARLLCNMGPEEVIDLCVLILFYEIWT